VDDDFTARAAIRQPAPAGCRVVVYGTQPSGGRPLAGCWAGTCAPLAVAKALLYSGLCLAAGSCRLLAVAPPPWRCLRLPAWLPSISTIFPTGEPITSPARAAHTHICGLDKTPPPSGRAGAGAFMAWATVGLPAGGAAKLNVLSKNVDHHNSTRQIGPVKRELPVVKQSDGKDGKKKSDKVVANPAISDGDVTYQICHMNHSATTCPKFRVMQQDDAVRRGELFPGKSDKDGNRKGAKTGQNLDSNEENGEKFCLVCSPLIYVPEWASRNHNSSQECGKLVKFNKQVGEGSDVDHTSRMRRDYNAGQRSSSQRSYTGSS
jgi:hypothetical protein